MGSWLGGQSREMSRLTHESASPDPFPYEEGAPRHCFGAGVSEGDAEGAALLPSPVKGQDHLQPAHFMSLHHGCAQLPLVSARQEPLGVRGDGKNVPEP